MAAIGTKPSVKQTNAQAVASVASWSKLPCSNNSSIIGSASRAKPTAAGIATSITETKPPFIVLAKLSRFLRRENSAKAGYIALATAATKMPSGNIISLLA